MATPFHSNRIGLHGQRGAPLCWARRPPRPHVTRLRAMCGKCRATTSVHVAGSRCPRRPRRPRPHAGPLRTFSTWKMAPAVPTASPGPCAPSVHCCSRQGQSQAAQEKVPCWQGRCREARALGVRVHGSIYRKCKPVTASVACAGRARRPAFLLDPSIPTACANCAKLS